MALNLKYSEKGTMSNVSQWFVKAPVAGPHLFLFLLLLEPAARGIYMASTVPSFLNFPCLTPVSIPERALLTTKGDFLRPHPSSSGPWADIDISPAVLFSAILHFSAPCWVPLAGTSSAGRDQKCRCTVWGKQTRDRIKILKMGLGDSSPLGSRAPFLGAK